MVERVGDPASTAIFKVRSDILPANMRSNHLRAVNPQECNGNVRHGVDHPDNPLITGALCSSHAAILRNAKLLREGEVGTVRT